MNSVVPFTPTYPVRTHWDYSKSHWSSALSTTLLAGIDVSTAARVRWQSLARKPALIVANHVSLWDGPLLAALAPVRIVGVIDYEWYAKPWIRGVLQMVSSLGDVVALSAHRPSGLRSVLTHLRRGAHVVIFPEGGIGLEEQQPGLRWLQTRVPAVARLDLKLQGSVSRYRRPRRIELVESPVCDRLAIK